jgi:transketolase
MPAIDFKNVQPRKFELGPRRGLFFDVNDILKNGNTISNDELNYFEKVDLIYRTLCAVMFNFVPTSGHPGGSISSGRIVQTIIYNIADYDIANPTASDADTIVYAAGHKALGLYGMWALRNELVRAFAPKELPDEHYQMRFEDLLGFRKNPSTTLPLFKKFNAKALDGHPTPATPFVKVATGASGIGDPSAFGVALGAMDYYGEYAPKVHVIEGEGGMTPGRVHEAFASASAMRLHNIFFHLDFNQASIDSNRVCREGNIKGDYVQWDPAELCYLHDFNVIYIDDGKDFIKVNAAQKFAKTLTNKMPTALIYKTIKGWKYGIEGKSSHGAGHKFASDGFYTACKPFEDAFGVQIPRFDGNNKADNVEKYYYDTLLVLRKVIEDNKDLKYFADSVIDSKKRYKALNRKPRANHPVLENLYTSKELSEKKIPEELKIIPGESTTIRAVLGSSLNYLNKLTNGAFLGAAADLLGSTSVNLVGSGFKEGFFDAVDNPESRILSIGGICEDAMGAMMAGLGGYGKNIGVSSSYGAFISAMEHTAARLHGIGEQNKVMHFGGNYNTWILVNAHAGLKTGEDGPTHADPQCYQLLSGNFPKGILITLTPWEPGEVWSLVVAGLKKRPAVLSPFVTRPNEIIADRKAMNLAPAENSVTGVYLLRKAKPNVKVDANFILQESGVTIEFITKVLPRLDKEGINVNVYYISSAELFDLLSDDEKQNIYPYELGNEIMGITGFTLPTMLRWVTCKDCRNRIMHPFKKGHYLGSGNAESVLFEAGLDADNIYKEVKSYIDFITKRKPSHF